MQQQVIIRILKLLLALSCASLLMSCALFDRQRPEEKKEARINTIAFRRLPPAPTYNRLRWVQLPETLPDRQLVSYEGTNKRIMPVVHLKFEDDTLEEVALALAASHRYTSYCASTIANLQITLNTIGTIDELAQEIAQKANIDVVIDHQNRQVRFLAESNKAASKEAPAKDIKPEFYGKDEG